MPGLAADVGRALAVSSPGGAQANRYAPTVFVAEPWPEVYVQTAERHASFEQAARSYDATVNAYVEAGYSPCILPKASVQERVAFVLDRMAHSSAENKKPAEQ